MKILLHLPALLVRTNFSLSEPGTAASFKVYVMLTTGNEAGSNAVTVERP